MDPSTPTLCCQLALGQMGKGQFLNHGSLLVMVSARMLKLLWIQQVVKALVILANKVGDDEEHKH